MSIFPDDDKRRQRDDDLTDDAGRRGYGPPTPNAPTAFEGGAIRSDGGSRGKRANFGMKKDRRISVQKAGSTGMSRGCGCLLALVIVSATVIPIFVFVIGPMFGLFNVFGEDTREVPGDPAAFDPIASFAEIEAYAKGEAASIRFIEMDATYVKSDGTLDLTAESYFPQVTYRFVIPAERPENAPPIGAGGSTGDYEQLVTIRAFQPGQLRSVTTMSGGSRTSYTYKHLGLERDIDDPLPAGQHEGQPIPECSFADLWETAVRRDAPRDAVAIIRYDDGEYSFNISGLSIFLEFDQSCALTD